METSFHWNGFIWSHDFQKQMWLPFYENWLFLYTNYLFPLRSWQFKCPNGFIIPTHRWKYWATYAKYICQYYEHPTVWHWHDKWVQIPYASSCQGFALYILLILLIDTFYILLSGTYNNHHYVCCCTLLWALMGMWVMIFDTIIQITWESTIFNSKVLVPLICRACVSAYFMALMVLCHQKDNFWLKNNPFSD